MESNKATESEASGGNDSGVVGKFKLTDEEKSAKGEPEEMSYKEERQVERQGEKSEQEKRRIKKTYLTAGNNRKAPGSIW